MNVRPKISAAVVCFNEERNIADCLESLKWCDEIVVVDSFSTDRTVEIAKRYTDTVIQRAWPGYVAQKQFALEQGTGDWIFCVDSDERCTPELRAEIEREISNPGDLAGLEVKRHVKYLGRWINHGGWYPDYKCRVVRRGQARWMGDDPHDKLVPDGPARRLDGELHHFTYRDFSEQLRTIQRFSDVVTDVWVNKGKRFSLFKAIFHPPVKFFECYVWKAGFLDGWPGFVIAVASSFYVFAKYVKLREKQGGATAKVQSPKSKVQGQTESAQAP